MMQQPAHRDRRLVLHIGATKTGTSALQVGLVRNRDRLHAVGIRYPESESDRDAALGKITSGNGLAIASFLNPKLPFSRRFARPDFLADFFSGIAAADGDCILYSSEHMGFFVDENLRAFANAARREGFVVEIVYFVRNVLEHAYSAYNQGVKRHRLTADFETFIRTQYRCPFAGTLRRLSRLFEKHRIHLLSYDDANPHLLKCMMGALGFAAEGVVETAGVINRSLTREEVEIMRFVIPHLRDDNDCRKISDALIYANEALQEDRSLSRETMECVNAKFQPAIDFVNQFMGRSLLAAVSEIDGGASANDLASGAEGIVARIVQIAVPSGRQGQTVHTGRERRALEPSTYDEVVRSSALAAAARLTKGAETSAVRNIPAEQFVALMVSDMERRVARLTRPQQIRQH